MPPTARSEKKTRKPAGKPQPPRVLLVEDEPALAEVVQDIVGRGMGCQVLAAANIAQAKKILATEKVDLVITDINLPDGDGMNLLPAVRKHHPTATAIVITGAASMDNAITAIQGGAVDFVPKPFDHTQLVARVRKALDRQAVLAREEQRFDRLRDAVKRLNASRKVISKKVDLLCNDLVTAYGELSRQLDGVRTQEGFRKYVEGAKDLEQLLCHAMDWLLRQIGYSNVAVWLAAEDGDFQLGAYMKYTAPGEPLLTDAMKRVILPLAVRDGLTHVKGDELKDKFTPQEAALFKGQDILAVNCTYLGDSLAAIVFFRDAKGAFEEEFETLLKSVSPIFAVTLASVVRGSDNEADDDDEDHDDDADRRDDTGASEGGNGPFLDKTDDGGTADRQEPKKKKEKIDPADWWKRGETPPF
jgi:response regulator of citrate/malate metabolism